MDETERPFEGQTPKEVTLKLADVIVTYNLNPRSGINPDTVAEYAEIVDQLPPMIACDVTGRGLILIAGFHRYMAHARAGRDTGSFLVFKGSWEEGEWYADTDNLRHGLPLTQKEKRLIIARMLQRRPYWSDAGLARACASSDKTVRSVRQELEKNGIIEEMDRLMGSDRIWRPRQITRELEDRRGSSLEERLTSCQYCDHPISERHHLLDVARWGENEYTDQMCSNCHELCEIIGRVIDTLNEGKTKSRSVILLTAVIKKWGIKNDLLNRIRYRACEIWGVKAKSTTTRAEKLLGGYFDE